MKMKIMSSSKNKNMEGVLYNTFISNGSYKNFLIFKAKYSNIFNARKINQDTKEYEFSSKNYKTLNGLKKSIDKYLLEQERALKGLN